MQLSQVRMLSYICDLLMAFLELGVLFAIPELQYSFTQYCKSGAGVQLRAAAAVNLRWPHVHQDGEPG